MNLETHNKAYHRKEQTVALLLGAPLFFDDSSAKAWKGDLVKKLEGSFANMEKGEISKSIRAAKITDLEGKAKALRLVSDYMTAHTDAITGNAHDNFYLQMLISDKKVAKSMGELITYPENFFAIQTNNRYVSGTPYDSQWMSFYNTSMATGADRAVIYDLFMDATFVELGETQAIPYVDLGDDARTFIDYRRFGKGFNLPEHHFDQNPSLFVNNSLQSLRIGNEAAKSNEAYTLAEAASTGTHTLSGTGTVLEQQMQALNAAAYTLMLRFQQDDRKSLVATPNMIFVVPYNESHRGTVEAMRKAEPNALSSTAVTLAYNFSFVPTFNVTAQPNAGTDSLLVGIPFGKNNHVVFKDLMFNTDTVFDNSVVKVGGKSNWNIVVGDTDQWTSSDIA